MDTGEEPSPDVLELVVDGMAFRVAHDPSQPGAYHYTRLAGASGGPAIGYGFTSRSSDLGPRTTANHVAQIHAFVHAVDPDTGYIEEDDG